MGEAKRRGTFEERQALAIQRNATFEQNLSQVDEKSAGLMKKAQSKYGTQRLMTRLTMCGLSGLALSLSIPKQNVPNKNPQ